MRLWVIMNKNYARNPSNLSGYSRVLEFGSSFELLSVHAFIRKREAEKYIRENYEKNADLFEAVPADASS